MHVPCPDPVVFVIFHQNVILCSVHPMKLLSFSQLPLLGNGYQ